MTAVDQPPGDTRLRRPTYGGYRPPTSPGLFGLGLIPTVGLFAAVIVLVVVWRQGGFLAALTAFVAFALVFTALLVKDRDRRNLLTRLGERLAWWSTRRRKANIFRGGPLSPRELGALPLPGLGADTRLFEVRDSYDRPSALVRWGKTGDHTVVLKSHPEGELLVDDSTVDTWVANYGEWLASLADEPGLLGAVVIIETAPDTGARLRATVGAKADPRANPVSLAALREAAETFPVGTPAVTAWVALTYTSPDGAKSDPAVVGGELANRIAGLTAGLSATGAGDVQPATAQDLCEEMLVCFDPDKQPAVDAAHAANQMPDLNWDDVGPVAAEAYAKHYLHNGVASRTWVMRMPPRGVHHSGILAALLAPDPGMRKRVALHYRVYTAWKAAKIVDTDVRTTEFKVNTTKKPSARQVTDMRAAQQTADEEARGAALLQVALLVTVTVPDVDHLPAATTAIENAAAVARLRLTPAYGSQDSMFLGTTPLGVVFPRHVVGPSREAL